MIHILVAKRILAPIDYGCILPDGVLPDTPRAIGNNHARLVIDDDILGWIFIDCEVMQFDGQGQFDDLGRHLCAH